jgi:type IV pilus assembly protein PilO
MADNAFSKLPLLGQLGVAVFVALLIAGGFYYFKYEPMTTELAAKTAEYSKLQSEIRTLEVTASKLDEFRREVTAREAKLETLKRILPADKETPELMKKVQYLAAQSNLNIRKFTPGATIKKSFQAKPAGAPAAAPPPGQPGQPGPAEEFYEEWPINVEVDGTYHNLGFFLDRVRRLSRLVNVGNIRVKNVANPAIGNTVNVQCVATTFVYVDTPPPPAAAPGARP